MNAPAKFPALHLTLAGLTRGLSSATFGKLSPTRWVEDAATGERVGWFRKTGHDLYPLEWAAGAIAGAAKDEPDALAKIEAAVLKQRAWKIGRVC
jgi:hypothetical protein